MDSIKLATPEQVATIADRADLSETTTVWAMGDDLSVVRLCCEIDPQIMTPESSGQRKLLFTWGLENMLRVANQKAYYFNVKCEDETYLKIVEKYGAIKVSEAPEFRFKKVL